MYECESGNSVYSRRRPSHNLQSDIAMIPHTFIAMIPHTFRVLPLAVVAFAAVPLTGCRAARVVAAAFHSGAPSRAERRLIDERTTAMFRALTSQRLVVLPVVVIGKTLAYDSAGARTMAARMRSAFLTDAVAESPAMTLAFQPSSNESAIFWSRFKALAANVQASPPQDADYVMLIDVLGAPDRGAIAAVHVMVVNKRGEMAYHAAWNSAQSLYKQVRPKSIDDAVHMVAIDMSQRRRTIASQISAAP